MMRARSLLVSLLFAGALAACSTGNTVDERFAYVEEPVEVLYTNGAEALDKRRFEEAILYFGTK